MKRLQLVLLVLLALPSHAVAQEERADVVAAVAQEQNAPAPGGMRQFVIDVGGDYKHFFSWSTAKWLGAGGIAALAVHQADASIHDATKDDQGALPAGQTYGDTPVQLSLAVGWWIVGHAAGNMRAAAAGRDLVRAQISAGSWTYVLKYASERTRPNGDPRSFPSGHASATFATAMVLQESYGWKLGVPFFALATYTAASRVVDNKHWASDAVFGAFLGMTSGRTVTLHLRNTRVTVAPTAVPGGGAVTVGVRTIE